LGTLWEQLQGHLALAFGPFTPDVKEMTKKRLLSGKQVFWSYCVVTAGALVVNEYYDFGDLGQLPPLVHWFYVAVLGFNAYAVRYLFRGEQKLLMFWDYGSVVTALLCIVLLFFFEESLDTAIRAQSLFLVMMGVSGYYICQQRCCKDTEESAGETSQDD
jgi:hypothetical protein